MTIERDQCSTTFGIEFRRNPSKRSGFTKLWIFRNVKNCLHQKGDTLFFLYKNWASNCYRVIARAVFAKFGSLPQIEYFFSNTVVLSKELPAPKRANFIFLLQKLTVQLLERDRSLRQLAVVRFLKMSFNIVFTTLRYYSIIAGLENGDNFFLEFFFIV